jgi:hypothetical protein
MIAAMNRAQPEQAFVKLLATREEMLQHRTEERNWQN